MPLAGVLGLPSLSEAAQAALSPYRRPKLKITEIRTAEIRVHGYQVHVRIYTDAGIVGQGESTDAAQGNVPLIRSFGRLLIGQDPLNIEAAFERIRTAGIFAGAQSGQYVTALTGVEIALWDIAGKALGLPVYQLMGGKVRDRVRVYCDSGAARMVPGDERSLARIQEIQKMGFTATKIDIDDAADPARFDRVNWTASNGEIDHMLAKIAFTRENGSKNRCRRKTSTPCATFAPPPARPSAAARTFFCGTDSARFWRSAPPTSSCPISRSAAASWKRARSPTWRTPTTCPWRRMPSPHPSA